MDRAGVGGLRWLGDSENVGEVNALTNVPGAHSNSHSGTPSALVLASSSIDLRHSGWSEMRPLSSTSTKTRTTR